MWNKHELQAVARIVEHVLSLLLYVPFPMIYAYVYPYLVYISEDE